MWIVRFRRRAEVNVASEPLVVWLREVPPPTAHAPIFLAPVSRTFPGGRVLNLVAPQTVWMA